MNIRIVVDSTADVREGLRDRLTVVPLTVHFGEEEYIDGVTITHAAFYEKLVESDVLPTTSQATPAAFADVLDPIVEAGDCAVVLTVSQQLSGTYQSAVIAASEYPERVFVVDSKSASIGAGILAERALQLVDDGLSAAEIAARLCEEREALCVIAMLDTLEYLKRGGRISKTAAFAAGVLSIKPVIGLEEGDIRVLGKARGSKQANNLLAAEIAKAGGIDFDKPLLMGYTGLSDVLLQKYIRDSEPMWKDGVETLACTVIGSVIGTHAGPGAIAAAFFRRSGGKRTL